MGDEKNADRSAIEIRNLLRKLDPDRGKHGDRVRAMTKFRNYVSGGKSPEFYDDDLPLLFLGNAAPASYLDPDDDTLVGLYGLLQACGSSSSEKNDGSLKRSARPAMELCKLLLLDWKEPRQKKGSLSLFASSFLSLPVQYYAHMRLDLHCCGDDRGGAKLLAFQLILLILKSHLTEDGETSSPVTLKELLPQSPKARQEFEKWAARLPAAERDALKKNAVSREKDISDKHSEDAQVKKVSSKPKEDDLQPEVDDGEDPDDLDEEADLGDLDDDDVVGALRKRRKDMAKELKSAVKAGDVSAVSAGAVATRWEDCQLAREQKAKAASAARAGKHVTVRDSKDAEKEELERESEKKKVLGKDPLGIMKDKFDLRDIDRNQAEHIEKALVEVQEELQKAEVSRKDDLVQKVAAKKESIEALIEDLGGLEAMEHAGNLKKSVLPTSPKFDPILFLTLVHRNASYEKLVGSLDRLTSKTENQVEQLENLVRENFPLFVKCAEGFDEFRSNAENDVGLGLNERIDKLDGIAESCAFQAKKSFRPLLDNTTEVRKVQSAIAVLQRVAPVLQAPVIMRQHLENRRYSEALKTYRRVLVVDSTCKIDLLLRVKAQAEECVREAQRELERRLADEKASVDGLLDGIRDLGELLELDVPAKADNNSDKKEVDGVYAIGDAVINIRRHSPAMACLLLQAAHFSNNVKKMVIEAEETTQRLFSGESLVKTQHEDEDGEESRLAASADSSETKVNKGANNQWKYDVLDARVISTVNAVAMARSWLPRLLRVGQAAREDEKRKAARIGRRRGQGTSIETSLRAFEVFITNVTPALSKLLEHASFCALGSNPRAGATDIGMTFGQNFSDSLRSLLKSPLPPVQSAKVGKELADLVDIVGVHSGEATALRPESESSIVNLSPFDECKTKGESAVVTLEKRRCIYSFDVCARASGNKASGSGKFDADSLLHCLRTLSQQLSRPEECSAEVEKGCQLVVRRCCEGLAGYVRDRGDDARLAAVSECADVISYRIKEIVQEVRTLTSDADSVEEALMEDVVGLENAMFEEYMENLHQGVAASVKIGWMDVHADPIDGSSSTCAFPAYLSASLLAIVRCRAQVEQTLGDKVRLADGVPYQRSCMSTVAQGVVEGICNEILQRKTHLKVRQADKLANELEFLNNTLKKFLGKETKSLLDSTLNMANMKAGRGQDYQGNGPDGLAALEELERLGRVYVLCLGE
ncbi:hypothetical protein ACA910_018232 [Epithemia clementina (nom. ined.)]